MKKVKKAVLPVAGLGTRFLPATKSMPKEMLTVVDKPLIQHAVEEAIKAGIEDIIFVTGRGKSSLENHFDKPYELSDTLQKKGKVKELEAVMNIVPEGVRIFYTRQGDPKGLGHAIACAAPIIGDDEPFAVLLPDDIIHDEGDKNTLKQMVEAYEQTGKPVVLVEQVPQERVSKYGILDIAGNTVENGRVAAEGFVEKPAVEDAPSDLAVTGRYILPGGIMKMLQEATPGHGGEIQLTDSMHDIAKQSGFVGHILTGTRFDCGDKVGFQMANLFFALKDDYIGPRLADYIHQLNDEINAKKKSA